MIYLKPGMRLTRQGNEYIVVNIEYDDYRICNTEDGNRWSEKNYCGKTLEYLNKGRKRGEEFSVGNKNNGSFKLIKCFTPGDLFDLDCPKELFLSVMEYNGFHYNEPVFYIKGEVLKEDREYSKFMIPYSWWFIENGFLESFSS